MSGILSLPGSYIGGYLYDFNPNMLLIAGSLLKFMQVPIILLFVWDVKKRNA